MLFDPFEEEFDFPTFPVELCNGQGGKIKIFCHKWIDRICSIVFVNDQPKSIGIRFRGFIPGQFHYLVTYQACIFVNLCRGDHFTSKVILSSHNKECASLKKKRIQPMKINVSLIHDIIRSRLYRHHIQQVNVMNRTIGNVNENRNGSPEVQQGMHLFCTLLMMEFCPGIQTKAQVNGCAVKCIDHIIQIDPEVVIIDVEGPCLFDQDLSEISINASIPFFIGISKSRSGNWFAKAGVIQLSRESSQTVLNITKAFPTSELSKTHYQEMLPASKFSYSIVALIMINALLELIFWHKLHQLCKDCLSCIHFRSNNGMSEIMISSRKIFKTL